MNYHKGIYSCLDKPRVMTEKNCYKIGCEILFPRKQNANGKLAKMKLSSIEFIRFTISEKEVKKKSAG